MDLVVGTRLRSAVCETQIIVVRAPSGADVDMRCGGAGMLPFDAPAPESSSVPAEHSVNGGTAIGKRYVDLDLDLEVLCVKAGAGDLAVGNAPMRIRDAKSLPSSD